MKHVDMETIRIFVEVVYGAMMKNIWMIETIGNDDYSITSVNGKIEKNKLPRSVENVNYQESPPLLSLPFYLADVFLREVQSHLENNGIKTKNENHLEGELDAKQEHLKDMRMIVKKVLKIE